ncbi:MAG: YjbQ family protein [Veillonellaceae bacterium]|nr:YjbQ family protein [Veillonellaceae bacterium]
MEQFSLQTTPEGFVDITRKVAEIVRRSQVRQGICQVFVPHTTAGVTINENADPDVIDDLLSALNTMAPALRYRHGEGNSPAHLKSLLTGSSVLVPVEEGALKLGTWQGIYFCEYDGPRQRRVQVQVLGE